MSALVFWLEFLEPQKGEAHQAKGLREQIVNGLRYCSNCETLIFGLAFSRVRG